MGEGLPNGKLTVSSQSPRHRVKLTVDANDTGGPNPGVEKVVFYEDGKEVHTQDYIICYGHHEARHQQPGKHTYFAEVHDKDGNVARTNEVIVNFTGYTPHQMPTASLRTDRETCRKKIKLTADETDPLDNEGIEWIKFYEDGALIGTDTDIICYGHQEVFHEKPGLHTYFAEVKYKDGPTVRSNSVTVKYVGIEDTLLPTGRIDSNLEKAGQTAKLRADWTDEYDNEGIEKVVFLQNGCEVATVKDGILWYRTKVQPDTAGTHTYQARIHFNEGHTILTNEIKIDFSGEVLDLAPKAEINYHKKDNDISVRGMDDADNEGIARIVLFRDGVPIETAENTDRLTLSPVPPDDLGQHVYHGEVTDLGGHTVKTKEITLHFESLEEKVKSEEITLVEAKKEATKEKDHHYILVDTNGKTIEALVKEHNDFSPFDMVWILGLFALGMGISVGAGAGAAVYHALIKKLNQE